MTSIYISGLFKNYNKQQLETEFSKFGKIMTTYFKESYCFLEYKSENEAASAIKAFENSPQLRVELARGKKKSSSCFFCNKEGHWQKDCPERQNAKRKSGKTCKEKIKKRYSCSKSRSHSHSKRKKPSKKKKIKKNPSRSRSRSHSHSKRKKYSPEKKQHKHQEKKSVKNIDSLEFSKNCKNPDFNSNENTDEIFKNVQHCEKILPVNNETMRKALFVSSNPFFFELPFQNRNENLKTIARQLFTNYVCSLREERANMALISFSQCMGTGKTRITKDFLKLILSERYIGLLSQDMKNLFQQTILFYINFEAFVAIRFECEDFRHAFYYTILSAILDQMKIRPEKNKLWSITKIMNHCSFKNILEDLFINIQENENALKLLVDEEKLLSSLQKLREYVQIILTKEVKYIILAFDEIGELNERQFFSDFELKTMDENFIDQSLKTKNEFLPFVEDINRFYHIWRYYLNPLNSGFTGLLVAGKNSYIPFLGYKTLVETLHKTSPSSLIHINLNSLMEMEIKNIFDELRKMISFKNFNDYFNDNENLYEDLIQIIYFYSGGLGRIVSIIAESIKTLTKQEILNFFSSKESLQKFIENIGETDVFIQKINPLLFFEKKISLIKIYTYFYLLSITDKTFDPEKLVIDFISSSIIENIKLPKGYKTLDLVLALGLPYTTIDARNMKIILPEYFKLKFINQMENKKKNTHIYLLSVLQEKKQNLDSFRIFEILISISFYRMLKQDTKETIHFMITHDTEAIELIQTYEKISTNNKGEISTDVNKYFKDMPTNSINLPAEKSYGADCWIKLKKKKLLKFILIGLQMKCFFSGKTTFKLSLLEDEIFKIEKILEKLSPKYKDLYEEFIYCVVCPDLSGALVYDDKTKINSLNSKNNLFDSIDENDYIIYKKLDSLIKIRIIILTEECVRRITGKSLIDSQKNDNDLTESLQSVAECLEKL